MQTEKNCQSQNQSTWFPLEKGLATFLICLNNSNSTKNKIYAHRIIYKMKLAQLASKTNNKGNHTILRGQESAKRKGVNYRSILYRQSMFTLIYFHIPVQLGQVHINHPQRNTSISMQVLQKNRQMWGKYSKINDHLRGYF